MSRIAIKVCGVTEERDALEAAHLGVEAVGFHLWEESPRYVDAETVRQIVDRLPLLVHKIGVFRDRPLIRVIEAARNAGVTAIQFDGEEPQSFCAGVRPMAWFKTIRPGPDFVPESLAAWGCRTFLIRPSPGRDGVPPFAWRHVRQLSLYGDVVLGGGLDPVHVGLAIDDARPRGVDILSGIEVAPGKKDLNRLELLVEAVRRAERRILDEERKSAR